MNFFSNQMNALHTAFGAYRLALTGGPTPHHWGVGTRFSQYNLCWDAYCGALYDRRRYATYINENNLYAKTRQIYSLVADVVDFYADHVYPGVIDDQGVQNSVLLDAALPFVGDDVQKAAIKQALQWSKWASVSNNWLVYGAATGDTFLTVADDVDAGRVYLETRAPWHIKDLHLDRRGFVISSTEEFPVWDEEKKQQYIYKREMSTSRIKTYKDGSLFDYGDGEDIENPYGFVPLVYTQHKASPGIPGIPAFRGWKTLDEVNSLRSRLVDYVRTQADTPMMFIGGGQVAAVKVDGESGPTSERGIRLLQMGKEGTVASLSGNLDLVATEAAITSLLSELRERNLEVTTYQRLRESGNPSGVAARRLLGDVEARLSGPAGNYDAGLILALRQALAIAGMRQSEGAGGWSERTPQQRAFSSFDLNSYPRGDLNFGIAPRPLVPDTDLDKATTKQALYAAYKAGEDIGVPVEWQMERDGVSPDDLKSLKVAQEAEANAEPRVGDGFPNLAPAKEVTIPNV